MYVHVVSTTQNSQFLFFTENMKCAKSALENELIVKDTDVKTENDKSDNEANKRGQKTLSRGEM